MLINLHFVVRSSWKRVSERGRCSPQLNFTDRTEHQGVWCGGVRYKTRKSLLTLAERFVLQYLCVCKCIFFTADLAGGNSLAVVSATALDWLTIALNGASSSSSFYCCCHGRMNKETYAVICKNYRRGRRRQRKEVATSSPKVGQTSARTVIFRAVWGGFFLGPTISLAGPLLMLMRTLPCCYCSLHSTPRALGKQNDNCVFRKVKLAGGDLKVV